MIDYKIMWVDEAAISTALVREFLSQQHRERLLTESTIVELKRERSRSNVAEAVCALANTAGGVVLVGVDEADPTRLPGVDPDERDSLVNQLQTMLEPQWLPEVLAVRADVADAVVLVIRVDPDDRPPRPVLCQGRAFIRAPGRTVRATRDQLLALAAASADSTGGYPGGGLAVASSYFPTGRTGSQDDVLVPDLRIRVATGLRLRGSTGPGIVLSTPMRAALTSAVDGSAAARWAAGHLPRDEPPRWSTTAARLAWWDASRPVPRRWKPDVTLRVHGQASGGYLALVADIDIRDRDYARAADGDEPDAAAPILSIEDLADGFLRMLILAGVDLPQSAAGHLANAPVRADAVTIWVVAARHDLHRAAGLGRLAHDGDQHVTAAQHTAVIDDACQARQTTLDWLQRMLLDDGVIAGETEAERIVTGIPDVLQPGPW